LALARRLCAPCASILWNCCALNEINATDALDRFVA
jgi:hypothetical protein